MAKMTKELRVLLAVLMSLGIAVVMLTTALAAIHHGTLLSYALAAFVTVVAAAVLNFLVPYELRRGSWTSDDELPMLERWFFI